MVFTDSSILFVKFISQLVILSLQGDTSNIVGSLIFAAGREQCIAMCNTLRILVFNSTVSYAYNHCAGTVDYRTTGISGY